MSADSKLCVLSGLQTSQNIQLIVFHSTKAQKNLSPLHFQQNIIAKQIVKIPVP